MRETVIERMLVATRVTLQVTAPVALGFAFFSTDIVDLWLGDTAPAITASIITILAISTLHAVRGPREPDPDRDRTGPHGRLAERG